jgi:hypothetical protein
MEHVVAYSTEHVRGGVIPFAAYVVDTNETVLGRGVNRVRDHHDPAAHAEVEAIRDAYRNAGSVYLYGTTLLTSGEPCAMCYRSPFPAWMAPICPPGVLSTPRCSPFPLTSIVPPYGFRSPHSPDRETLGIATFALRSHLFLPLANAVR